MIAIRFGWNFTCVCHIAHHVINCCSTFDEIFNWKMCENRIKVYTKDERKKYDGSLDPYLHEKNSSTSAEMKIFEKKNSIKLSERTISPT